MKNGKSVPWKYNPDSFTFSLEKIRPTANNLGENCFKIWAKVISSDMLEIIIEMGFENEDGEIELEYFQYTHCGRFTIGWGL